MNEPANGYGAQLDPEAVSRVLKHIFHTNLALEDASARADPKGRGKRPTPICLWGSHGIGKTALIKAFANANGWKFRYCAPAQFEEMGDLHGLPMRVDPDPKVQGDEMTVYMPPEWVPREDDVGPGILLLDDINRADDRILRGIMQLLQEFELFSWTLPARWQIVCTANPEGGDYSVTTMDDAMLTRLLHITMVFDIKAWARWAVSAGVDPRGVAFVLTYPEVITGKRTTPRTLVQFFDQIRPIADLRREIELVNVLAQSSLDSVTAATFVAFVNDHLQQLLEPEEILEASDPEALASRMTSLAAGAGDSKRVDRLATVCTRLYIAMSAASYEPRPEHGPNVVAFLLHPDMPNDLRYSTHRDLVALGGPVAQMLRDRRLTDLLLGAG